MLTIRENNFRNEEQYITIDSLVPKNHLVRKIENAINLGEDIAIQSSEQLIVVARLLEKLHRILKEIQECCKDKNPTK